MDVKVEIKGLDEIKRDLNPKAVKRAIVRTINELERNIRTLISKSIREKYNIKAQRIKKGIRYGRARYGQAIAEIVFSREAPGLQHFGARQVVVSGGVAHRLQMGKHGMVGKRLKRGKRTGVSVEVLRGRRRVVQKGFMAMMPGGGVGVWKRKGKKRLPIRRLFGPSVGGMYRGVRGDLKVERLIRKKAHEVFYRNLRYYQGRKR